MLYFHYQFGSCSETAKQGCEKTDVDNIMLFTLFYLEYKWKLALILITQSLGTVLFFNTCLFPQTII